MKMASGPAPSIAKPVRATGAENRAPPAYRTPAAASKTGGSPPVKDVTSQLAELKLKSDTYEKEKEL